MATKAQLQARIDSLEDGIARGVTSVYVDGERVEYASIKDMLAAITYFRSQISALNNRGRRMRPIRVIPTVNY